MWKKIKTVGCITHNESYEGERIEDKVERFVNGGEAIKDGAPLIYTERKDGVKPEYNIRTDRFEVGLEAMNYIAKSERAKTIEMFPKNDGKGDVSNEPTQATNDNNK